MRNLGAGTLKGVYIVLDSFVSTHIGMAYL